LSALGDEQVHNGAQQHGNSGFFAHSYRYEDEDEDEDDDNGVGDYFTDNALGYGSLRAGQGLRLRAGAVDDIVSDLAVLRGSVSTLLIEQKSLRAELVNGLASINAQLAALLAAKQA
jgi:hypothetical protein